MAGLKERIDRLKQVHCLIATCLFVVTFSFCSFTASELNLMNISLSHFGIHSKIGVVWNVSLFIIGITLLIEAYLSINKFMLGKWMLYLFGFSIVCLFLTASINMNYKFHFYAAYTYFIGFTLGMFIFGYKLLKSDFRIGITSIVIAVVSVLLPVAAVMYLHSFAIPELSHTSFVFIWVITTRYDIRYKNFLKRIGL